jgi:DNA (cytosine-5)-methyltransferase 1
MLRLISETKPKYILIENVDAIRVKGLDVILRGLSEIGYAAEWHCIPAYSVGAPHRRERIWIISYPDIEGLERFSGNDQIRYTWPQPHGPACEKDLFSRKHFSRWWATEPKLGRVAHGIPRRVDRIKLLGNSVVPQIVTILGKAILARESLIN